MSDTLRVDEYPPAADKGFIMPGVSAETAAMQFFVEAMKANTAVLEGVQAAMVGIQAEQKEQLRLTMEVREKVAAMENSGVGRTLDEVKSAQAVLNARLEVLERDKDKRDGATTALGALWKNLPQIIWAIAGVILITYIVLQATGVIR